MEILDFVVEVLNILFPSEGTDIWYVPVRLIWNPKEKKKN